MTAFQKPTRRTAMIAGAACLTLIGAVGVGTAAMADGAPTPSASTSASVAPGAPGAPGAGAEGGAAPAAPAAGTATAPTPPKHEPHIGGEVQSVSGSTVTVQDPDGFTRTIVLGDDVTVTKDGASASASAIVKGEHIDATGVVASDGTTLDATAVSVGRPTPPKGGPGQGPKDGPAAPPAAAAPSTDGSATPPAPGVEAGGSGSEQPSGAPSTPSAAPTSGS